ncbi:SDR family NAD(P)-dependent oxidoreductase [Sphingomonas histidinilytica]|uniref:NAD(P)-dependent dehydrogenase, short-chain alcohol dehydrogenase family n=1 Tax=Rhizorhabdus histidinilytica TaxID=439228 RepID=A0A1T5ARZ3_9SPHN|nr:SDR family oxidoreductase [Rhizorhabdus histidinilytica]MBO9376895.1 SDR family NAD(P)-dependent oxidoreductase [Rhizorhabdus histidinilytica]SKB37639.1 NAD(P)-dependent dehydrogenase, short-chain alcohol dehydrogenase family [Rhizorhabdus histidinilytica]
MAGICQDRTVIITGAARGLGKSYALAFAREGANVVVNDIGTSLHGEGRDTSAADAVVEEIRAAGGKAVANYDDITDWDAAGRIVRTAIDSFGGLDVVVNNAGIVRDRMFVSATLEEWDATMHVHLRGHFCVSRHAVDYWRAQQKAGNLVDARIINTTSNAGLQGSIAQAAYSTAKGGIAALTLVQAAELGRYGITANALAPAARTRMTEGAFAEKMAKVESGFDAQDPDNIAPTVVWLGSAEARDVTGCVFELEGGRISIEDGWDLGPTIEQQARWNPAELGPVVAGLLAQRKAPRKVWGS